MEEEINNDEPSLENLENQCDEIFETLKEKLNDKIFIIPGDGFRRMFWELLQDEANKFITED